MSGSQNLNGNHQGIPLVLSTTMRMRRVLSTLGLATALGVSPLALAQTSPEGLDVQRFAPAPGGLNNLNQLEGAGVTGHLSPSFGLYLNYGYRPLITLGQDAAGNDISRDLLRMQIGADLLGAVGFGKRFQLGFAIPVTVLQAAGEVDPLPVTLPASATNLGDVRIVPKIKILGEGADGLALSIPISLPTGKAADYHGTNGVSVEGRLIYQHSLGEALGLYGNLGYAYRPQTQLLTLVTGPELRYGAGLRYGLLPSTLDLMGELFGALPLGGDSFSLTRVPLELTLSARLFPAAGHAITLGGGPGLVYGYGTPSLRVLAGYSYTRPFTPAPPDADKDGLLDKDDQCPNEPEDLDNFEDSNGCPDLDNDADGIPDTADKCPLEPEDKDGFQDEDGCPDPDNDKDGVLDAQDKCPTELEDTDTFEDTDGCPDPDNDKDGILDTQDACPLQPEDKDNLGDDDGCPETDHDKDGILDEKDLCPRKAEVINGIKDEDGCPDEGKAAVQVTSTKLEILEKVYFATDKTEILPRSYPVLKQVIGVLKANTQITRLAIEGHTDSQGNDDYNQKLSQGRVESVMKFLVDGGIDASRLSATGFGENRPIASNETEKGRAANRRVEFVIIEVDGKPVAPTTTTPSK